MFSPPGAPRGAQYRLEVPAERSQMFSERRSEVRFTPDGESVICQVHRWGAKGKEPSYSCERAQVIGELWRFLEGLCRSAVDQGYLTDDQAGEFLGHALPLRA